MNSPKIKLCGLSLLCLLLCAAVLGISSCAELKQPKTEPFYGSVAPPPAPELRWSNGDAPKTFDPALAVSASEMQTVRAVFEGLAEWNGKEMQAAPALAAVWESSEDFRTWTFVLRRDAVWTNGRRVTAADFVRSWKRLAEMGERSPHAALISNLVGSRIADCGLRTADSTAKPGAPQNSETQNQIVENNSQQPPEQIRNPQSAIRNQECWFGAEAVDDVTLRVSLVEPDKDFPKLAAHTALRPVFEKTDFEKFDAAKLISNGAFRFVSADKSGVALERSKNYRNAAAVKLERVRFVPAKTDEAALAAYQAGEVDTVTNSDFKPLALKVLASYKDFQRTTFNAVTFYEFNRSRQPFDNRKVREALAVAIDRKRLANDELDGASVPANKYLPHSESEIFQTDVAKAKMLLAEAGFPDGKDFPRFRVLIPRNDTQRRVARAVAAQWLKNLNVQAEIVESSVQDLEDETAVKDFDLVRRVAVLPTTNETANLQAMFGRREKPDAAEKPSEPKSAPSPSPESPLLQPSSSPEFDEEQAPPPFGKKPAVIGENSNSTVVENLLNETQNQPAAEELPPILTEAEAEAQIPAIPLYFPVSYALVKPYVRGFEPNLLDAPALEDVEIQTDWQQPQN